MSIYPNAIPTIAQVFDYTDDVDWMNEAKWDVMRDELIAIATELGITPSGDFATVRARLDAGVGGYVDRGDPATDDFLVGNFTTNGAWQDLDLSAIIPVGTKIVLFGMVLKDDVIGSEFYIREKGNANPVNLNSLVTQIANLAVRTVMMCSVDGARKIQYLGSNLTFTNINFSVRGWWL